jgi:phospholipid/cholesterol/gamma-HCH transport system substrate-binding protein
MKRDGINYSLVGAVVLVAFGLLLFALFSITGRSGSALRYHAYYANVTGLGPGAPVFYEGFRIGQVEAITPDRSQGRTRYRVELADPGRQRRRTAVDRPAGRRRDRHP